ncbi:hypothetical protein EH244_31085 [Variovorax beijingensis]|uniref:Uncharacterized protein n=1 Tax=Variovorax beijingensis TaxID=2496117 RepID=A0A3P3E0U4_9BURK|nr:hypothetical protein [Variovorax beijingensis]RRH80123.1 hypothetical protein EH244_31085 [Variovorax beijingensis]
MSRNPYSVFLDLVPPKRLLIATVTGIDGDVARLVLPGGGVLTARGVGQRAIGAEVYVRDGVIEGDAPADMPLVQVEI